MLARKNPLFLVAVVFLIQTSAVSLQEQFSQVSRRQSQLPNGYPCVTNSDCASGCCIRGICAAFAVPGEVCGLSQPGGRLQRMPELVNGPPPTHHRANPFVQMFHDFVKEAEREEKGNQRNFDDGPPDYNNDDDYNGRDYNAGPPIHEPPINNRRPLIDAVYIPTSYQGPNYPFTNVILPPSNPVPGQPVPYVQQIQPIPVANSPYYGPPINNQYPRRS